MPAQERPATDAEKTAPIQTRGLPIPDVPKRIIANEIEDRIKRGVYQPGENLPALTEMEKMTSAARGTIRAALKILSDQGYIRSVIGLGTTVLPREYWNHPEKLS